VEVEVHEGEGLGISKTVLKFSLLSQILESGGQSPPRAGGTSLMVEPSEIVAVAMFW